MRQTYGELLKQIPPFLCLAMARVRRPPVSWKETRRFSYQNKKRRQEKKRLGMVFVGQSHHRRMTREEVGHIAGLHPRTVARIGTKLTWQGVDVLDQVRFLEACGIDLLHIHKFRNRLRETMRAKVLFPHLTVFQRTIVVGKIKELNQNLESTRPNSP